MSELSQYDYHLPPDRIAQTPLENRDQSKLLVLHRQTGEVLHRQFSDLIDFLRAGDVLVANNSRVMAARLFGRKEPTGGKAEILLLESLSPTRWRALVGGKRLKASTQIRLLDRAERPTDLIATIHQDLGEAQRVIDFNLPLTEWLEAVGHTPLPPYIHEQLDDRDRYQTIFAQPLGSAAAPTAGLHFTPDLMLALREKGVQFETVTLHVGLDTFKPVTAENIAEHTIHSEWATLSPEAAQRINEAKLAGGRIVAVGTTSVRTLETAALRSAGHMGSLQTISQQDAAGGDPSYCPWRPVAAFSGSTDLFIYPGYRFRAVDALITNFHIPQSTLLMLVSALTGREKLLTAYEAALANDYRFLSFGDAMFLTEWE